MKFGSMLYRAGVVIFAASALVVTTDVSTAQALDPPVISEPYSSLTYQTDSPTIPVYNSNGRPWKVTNKIAGASIPSGAVIKGVVSDNKVKPSGLKPGLYTLSVTNATGTTTADFLIVGATPSPDPYYGVQTHFQYATNTWSAPKTTLNDLKLTGFSSIRDEVSWQTTEEKLNVLKVRESDATYQTQAAALNFDRLFTADFGNTVVQEALEVCQGWPDPKPCQRVPKTLEEQEKFAAYAIFVLKETGANRVELWNEYNYKQFNHWEKDGASYAKIFGPIAKMIKQALPNVQVVGGGIMGADVEWFKDFFAEADRLGYFEFFDAFSYHPYSNPEGDLATPGSYVDRVATIREAQKPYLVKGSSPKPMILSEVGWTTTPADKVGNPARALDDKVQAERLAMTYILHANAGVQTVYWYEGIDLGYDPNSSELNFGVYRTTRDAVRAFQPKESALAMWVLRNQLDGYKQTGLKKLDNGIWQAIYTNGPLTKLALFADSTLEANSGPDSNKKTVAIDSLVPKGKTAGSAVDAYGTPVDVSGKEVTIGSRPIYVTLSTPNISLKSSWNNLNVSARQLPAADGSPLEASARNVAGWETFTVVEAGQGMVALSSAANGKYVSVDPTSANASLKASATEIRDSEKFKWIDLKEKEFALQSKLKTKFVSAWADAPGAPLRATVGEILGWERFTWAPQ